MRYDFGYSDDSPYGHIVRLLDDHIDSVDTPDERGLVIDLGCGLAAIEAPAVELGFSYCGLDGDAVTVDELVTRRGIDAHLIDLVDVAGLAARLDAVTAGRSVAAITAIDVLEHLPRPDQTLRALHAWARERGSPALLVSVPNVGHVDLATKLVTGRWDVTPTGLLDETHLRFFNDRSVSALMSGTGFAEIARDDFRLIFSDQAWPPDHPAQSPESMLGRYLRTLRESTDEHAETNQFVRMYSPTGTPIMESPDRSVLAIEPDLDRPSPFLSVITRTTGNRSTLVGTLACLSGQTDADFEILLMVNTDDSDDRDSVLDLVASFDESFRDRIRVDVSDEMHRVAPLNRALDLARGRYITVLDDDDFVFGDWVEQFHRAADEHPGAVVRCRAVDQHIDTVGGGADGVGPAVATSGFEAPYRSTFDLASHFAGGQSPQGTLAVPHEALDTFNLRFDEAMVVCEDIEFYLRVTSICGVVDTATFGMVYRRWTDRFASQHTVAPEVWEQAIQEIVRRFDAGPMLMPAGTASRLYQTAAQERQLHDLDLGTSTLLRRVEVAERNWAAIVHDFVGLDHRYRDVAADRDRMAEQIATDAAAAATAAAAAAAVPLHRRIVRRGRRMLFGKP